MNMASVGILLFISTVIYYSPGNAKNGFINLQCKTENVGLYGQQSLLECVTHTGQDVSDTKIRVVTWKKEGVEKPLLVFNKVKITKQPGYDFAEPSWNDRNMNVSLLIVNTAVDDQGSYTCVVVTDSGDDTTQTGLSVTATYNVPTINSSPETITSNTDGSLTCQTDAGYPEGKLRWFDEHGEEWTKSSEMIAKKTERGLFHLSSTLTLLRGSIFSKYTCVVFNASGGKEDEATFEIQDERLKQKGKDEGSKGTDSASKIVAPIVVIGSLIVGLLMALLLYRRRAQLARRQSTTPLMGDHQGVHTCDPDGCEGGDSQEMDKTHQQDSLA